MNNLSLVNSLLVAASKHGYKPLCGDKNRMARMLPPFPSAWIELPALHSVEGRSAGRTTYDVVMHLFDAGAELSHDQRMSRLARMENDMVDIFTSLSDVAEVVAVENLTVTSGIFSQTNRGELSQTAKARIITWF